ncbi:TPA: hypothetical protein QC364_000766 [Bacillus cereus]|nr:hypothetical protein [Bacillus cereus]
MEVKVTKPQIKKMLEKHGEVTLTLFERGTDPNDRYKGTMQATIKDISEIDGRLVEAYRKFSGRSQFSLAIWKDEEEENE